MKVVAVSLLMLGIMVLFIFGVDLVMGLSIQRTVDSLFSNFQLVEPVEILIFLLLLLSWVVRAIIIYILKQTKL